MSLMVIPVCVYSYVRTYCCCRNVMNGHEYSYLFILVMILYECVRLVLYYVQSVITFELDLFKFVYCLAKL